MFSVGVVSKAEEEADWGVGNVGYIRHIVEILSLLRRGLLVTRKSLRSTLRKDGEGTGSPRRTVILWEGSFGIGEERRWVLSISKRDKRWRRFVNRSQRKTFEKGRGQSIHHTTISLPKSYHITDPHVRVFTNNLNLGRVDMVNNRNTGSRVMCWWFRERSRRFTSIGTIEQFP